MIHGLKSKLITRWRVFWLWHAGYGFWGRMGSRLASVGVRPHCSQHGLAVMTRAGFISPTAKIFDVDLKLGPSVFIGERVVIWGSGGNRLVELQERSQINQDCGLDVGAGGAITIGPQAGVQKGCILSSSVQPLCIGRRAQIAAYCSFYTFDHGMASDREIFGAPLTSKGPIIIGEDAWLGAGVRVTSGVTIGRGAVVGTGSVVTSDIPEMAIAVGVPARVIKFRRDMVPGKHAKLPLVDRTESVEP